MKDGNKSRTKRQGKNDKKEEMEKVKIEIEELEDRTKIEKG
jgi:hypothetical protein